MFYIMAKTNTDKKTSSFFEDRTNRIATITGGAALAIGLLVGHFAFGSVGVPGVTNVGSATVTSSQTNEVIGTYTYKGAAHGISVQDILDYTGGSADENGNYDLPSAETVMNYARAQITREAAKKENITVTDDDLTNFVKNQYGYESLEDFATQLNINQDQVKTLLEDAVAQQMLHDKIVGKTLTAPTYPTAPEEGKTDEATADYAAYIQELAGDAWNKETGTWADADSDFAKATAEYDITNDSATFDAALAVYQVVYNSYSAEYQELEKTYTAYMDELYKDCTISIGTLVQ